MTVTPTILTYAPGEKYNYVDGGTGRLVNFMPFVPPPTLSYGCGCGSDCPIYTPQTLAQFETYYTALLAAVPGLRNAWVAETLATGVCPPTPTYVISAGIIYLAGNTYGIWTGQSWTVSRPPRPQYFPSWMTFPNFRSPR